MKIRFGHRDVEYPSAEMGELRASNDLLGDIPALHTRMAEDGYLLLRGLIDPDKVLRARRTVLEHMQTQDALTPNTPVLEGVMPRGGRSVPMMGRKGVAYHGDVLAVIESAELYAFFDSYFGQPSLTFDYKWLRAVGNEQYTGAHFDYVYMGQGSPNLHTVWIPMGEIPIEQGVLAMCRGSHSLDSFERLRQTYGRMDVDRDHVEGWFTRDPMEIVEKFGGEWLVSAYGAGDVMIFGMHTMHASTTNLTNRFRLSCDVRYQPAADPADPRWVGAEGTGHTALGKLPLRSMEEVRVEWGV